MLLHRLLFSRDDIFFEGGGGVRRVELVGYAGYDNMDGEVEGKSRI